MVMLARARSSEQHISEFIEGDFDVLDILSLRSGGAVWVLSTTESIPDKDARWWQFTAGDMKFGVSGDLSGVALASYTSAAHLHPYPAIRDMALGRSNLRLEP